MRQEDSVTCACNVCSGGITFGFKHIGKTVQCPHCGIETVLYDTRPKPEPPPPPPEPKKKIAKVVKGDFHGGLEESLNNVGYIIFSVCFLSGVILVLVGFTQENSNTGFFIVVGVAAAIQGWIFKLFLDIAAEVIRLLKKQAGLDYSGKISQPTRISFCSNCRAFAGGESEKECKSCGAEFQLEPHLNSN